jgi:crotonobetainyl-CoA:carnitine CoA-transferase CaiB-like acyl-CoA transferase
MNLVHPRLGDIGAVGMGLPIQFSKSKAQFDQPATELGAANEEVYGNLLKLSPHEIAELRRARVI